MNQPNDPSEHKWPQAYVLTGVDWSREDETRKIGAWQPRDAIDRLESPGLALALFVDQFVRQYDAGDWSRREWTCGIVETWDLPS